MDPHGDSGVLRVALLDRSEYPLVLLLQRDLFGLGE
jgi:hypothetical protein